METNRSNEADQVVTALAALAQTHRLSVFRALVRVGNSGLAAGDIAEQLSLPASSLSFHLANLRESGLVRDERIGRSIIYRANFEAMASIVQYLLDECCSEELADSTRCSTQECIGE
ncbi:MAG: metalloregulator ArsR/SmtB family transcription factor [Erythrobacter sp.]